MNIKLSLSLFALYFMAYVPRSQGGYFRHSHNHQQEQQNLHDAYYGTGFKQLVCSNPISCTVGNGGIVPGIYVCHHGLGRTMTKCIQEQYAAVGIDECGKCQV